MIFYENDEMKIPKRYKKMTIEQLRREGKILEKIAIVIAKISSLKKKKRWIRILNFIYKKMLITTHFWVVFLCLKIK